MAEDEENFLPNIGVVKLFNEQKGFGFIIPYHGSEDLYFHRSSILSNDGSRTLAVGTVVEFAFCFGGDGLTKAVDITVPNVVPVQRNIRGESHVVPVQRNIRGGRAGLKGGNYGLKTW